jgi:hypothetical protein
MKDGGVGVDKGAALGPRGSGLGQRKNGGFVPVSVSWENGGFGIPINADYVGVLVVGRTGEGSNGAGMETEEREEEEEEEKGGRVDFHFLSRVVW